MRISLTGTIFGAFGLVALLLAGPRTATAIGIAAPAPADWGGAFVLRGSGFDNPTLWLMFNPQPEPPAHPPEPGLHMDNPLAPVIAVPTGNLTDLGFRILFGINGATPLDGTVPGGMPDPSGHFAFGIATATGGPAFTVIFDIVTVPDSPGGTPGAPDPASWVGFNPQPEPPALGSGAAFGFDFDYTHFSDAQLTVQVLDANGTPIAFEQVPAPASMWLLLAGLVVLRRPWRA